MRKQCSPKGPVGYLLETLYLNAAVMDMKGTIRQYNQPALDVLKAPYQVLAPCVRQMATRNRTMRASNGREETAEPYEIDKEVTMEKRRAWMKKTCLS